MPILNLSEASGTFFIEPGVWQVERTIIADKVKLIGKPGAVIELQEDSVPHSSLLTLRGSNSSMVNVRLIYKGRIRPKTLVRIDGVGSRVIQCDITGNNAELLGTNDLHDMFGIWLNADHVGVYKSAIRDCFQGVVSTSGLSRLKVVGCLIDNLGEHGVYFAQGNNYIVKDNAIRQVNGHAIKIQIPEHADFDSTNIVIQRNICESNCNHGIVVSRVTNASHGISRAVRIEDNEVTVTNRCSGVVVIAANGVSILRNSIHNAHCGLDLRGSENVDYGGQVYDNVRNPIS